MSVDDTMMLTDEVDDHDQDEVEPPYHYMANMVARSLCDVPWPCMDFTVFDRIFGDAAKNQVARNSENIIFDAKRLIWCKFADSSRFDSHVLNVDATEFQTNLEPFFRVHFC